MPATEKISRKKVPKAITKAELKRFLDIITGKKKKDVYTRLTKGMSPKTKKGMSPKAATDDQTAVSQYFDNFAASWHRSISKINFDETILRRSAHRHQLIPATGKVTIEFNTTIAVYLKLIDRGNRSINNVTRMQKLQPQVQS